MKIDILGSCVTRDAFSLVKNNYEIGSYFSRSSILSLYSRKLSINQNQIKLSSNFQKRMVYFDLVKRFRSYIKDSNADYLIIDLIDERFKVGKVDNSYITISTDFLKSGIDLDYKKLNIERKNAIWFDKANNLISDLRLFGAHKVILHKAFWKQTYIDDNKRVCKFDDTEAIIEQNEILKEYYKYIEDELFNNGLKIIEEFPSHADASHKWGLEPFHYETRYYENLINKVDAIINQKNI